MRSKAHFKSHPLHPILVTLPIGFFIGALVFDLLSFITGNSNFWQTGFYLSVGGIIGAVLAAVPGVIDYFHTVPPKSSAKKRASQHAVLNLTNLALFCVVVFYRRNDDANETLVVVLEVVGVGLMSVAGWMGGTLVHRNQIGVDHRYANAGKWNEAYIKETSGTIEVAKVDELKIKGLKLLHIGNKRIVLGRTEKGHVAFSDYCTHKGGSLAGGVMICGTVHCPWHGSHFDVETGAVKAGPATEKIETYAIEEKEGKVYLML